MKFIPCAASRDVDRHQTTHLAHLSRGTNAFWVVILVVTQFLFVICRSSAVISSLTPVRPIPVRVRQLEVQNEILFTGHLTFGGEVVQHVARETRRGRRRRCKRRTRQTRNGRRREWVLTGQENVRWWIGCGRIRCLFGTRRHDPVFYVSGHYVDLILRQEPDATCLNGYVRTYFGRLNNPRQSERLVEFRYRSRQFFRYHRRILDVRDTADEVPDVDGTHIVE